MTSTRSFSIALLVIAAFTGVFASPAQAQLQLNCNTSSFPNTMVLGTPYNMPCTASGGVGSYAFDTTGQLPFGISFIQGQGQANLQGTPTFSGTYNFTVKVTDSANTTQSQSFQITVNSTGGGGSGGFTVTSVLPNPLTAGVSQAINVLGTGFTSNSTVVFNGVSLATTFQATTQLSATPPANIVTAPSVQVYVRDNLTGVTSTSFTVTVSGTGGGTGGVTLSQLSPSSVAQNSPGFTLTLYGSGFSNGSLVSFGSLFSTPGTLQGSGVITAFIPQQFLTTSQTVQVQVGSSNTLPFVIGSGGGGTGTILISCSPNNGPSQLNINFSQLCSASNGNGNYTWTVSGLPSGVSQVGTTGTNIQIFGTPNVSQSYNYTVQATDTGSHVGSVNYSGSVGTGGGNNITLSQSSVAVGSAGFNLNVFGTGFQAGISNVYFSGTLLTTTFVSSNQLTAFVPQNLLTFAQSATITVITSGVQNGSAPFTVGTGGGTSGVTVTQLQPSSTPVGSPGVTITIYGSGFTQGMLASFGSNSFNTTFQSSGQLQTFIPAQFLTTAQTVNVSVGGSNSQQFVIGGGSTGSLQITCNPTGGPTALNTFFSQTCTTNSGTTPYNWTVTGLPSGLSQSANTGQASVTISGTPTVAGAYSYTVQVTEGSASHLTGSLNITGSLGSSSYGITSLAPSQVAAGSAQITLTVFGNGFTNASLVYFNGAQLTTQYISPTQLNATLPSFYLTTAQSASVSVNTSGLPTNTLPFTIGTGGGGGNGGTISILCNPGIGPSVVNTFYSTSCTATGGNGNYTWSQTGLPAFLTFSPNGATVTISGTSSSPTTYNFTLKVTDSGSPVQTGTQQIAGQTNNPNSGTGSIILTSLSPNSAGLNSGSVNMSVNGSGFATNSQVNFDGFPIVTTFLSSNQLLATIPAGQLTFARGALVNVTTPGVGSSNSLTFTIGNGGSGSQISITCNPGVGPSSPNAYYTSNCAVNGGNAPYNWTIVSGALPSGLTLLPNGALATINGYSTLNGSYSYTLQVTDSSAQVSTAMLVFAGQTGASTGGGGSTFSISSLSPSSASVGSNQVNLTVNGTNFAAAAQVYFNGSPLQTTYLSATQLSAVLPASYLTAAQNASVTVISSGQTSNSLPFTVGTTSTAPISISCNPTTGPSSSGSNYTTSCNVTGGKAPYVWTGLGLPFGLAVTNASGGPSVSITGSIIGSAYNYSLQVSDSSTPALTSTYPFVGTFSGTPTSAITSVSPISANAGSGGVTLTISGTNFTSGVTQVQFGTTPLITTVNSPTLLTATVPANLLLSPGTVFIQLIGTNSNSVGFFVTAGGSSGVNPGSLTFTYGIGGTLPPAQNISVNNLNGATGFSIVPSGVANGITWLGVTQGSGVIPGSVGVTVTPGALPIGSYSGTLTITGFGVGTSVVIPVTLNVTGPPALVPSSLNLVLTSGQGGTATKTISVTTSDGTTVLPYNISTLTNNGGNWLSVSANNGSTPGSFTVSANAANLTPSTYSGTITLVATGSLASQVSIPVTLTVTTASNIVTNKTSLTFSAPVGQNASDQTISVSASDNSAVNYTVLGTTQKGGGWLFATPTGITPGTITVSILSNNLPADTYTGFVTITAQGLANSPLAIPITLVVGGSGSTLTLSPQTLTFNAPVNGAAPASQPISVTSSGAAANYTVTASSSGNWLSATASGTTPGTISVSVNQANLAAGQYTGTLTVTSPTATNSPQTVQVTLNVGTPSAITPAPGNLSFFVPGDGSAPSPQSFTVFFSGGSTPFTVSATSQGGNWLTASGGGQTPGNVVVSVNPSGLSAGQSYNGSVTINAPNANPSSVQVPVTLTLAATGAQPLQVIPSALYLPYTQGAGSELQHVAVLNPGSGTVNFTAVGQTANCGNWLTVATPSGSATASAPGVVAFNVNPSGITTQTCRASVSINDGAGKITTVPVYMSISGQAQAILLSQTAMNFTAAANGSAPPAQSFQILNPGSGSMPWNVSTQVLSGGTWLSVAPNSGTAQSLAQAGSPISVTVNPQGLAAGVYYGTVQVTSSAASNSPQFITVSLTVVGAGSSPAVLATPNGVILTGINGSADAQTVTLSNSGSSAVNFTTAVITDDGQAWLAAPTSGTVAAGGTTALNVAAGVNGLSSGLRHGTLRIAFSNGTVQTVDVQLAIAGSAGANSTGVRACAASNLAMEFQSPSQNFQTAARVAVPLQVLVKDCSGNPLTSSSTGVEVFAGTSSVRLTYIGSGIWSGIWTPTAAAPVVALTARAVSITGGATASGVVTATGQVGAPATGAPAVVAAVVNAGSFLLPGLVAPGTMVSIFGSGLANGQSQVFSTPFPTTLQGAQFSLRGSALPLFYASDTQVNAVIPIGLAANERDQLLVVRDTTQSVPVDLLVADVDPGAFATNQQGTGQGAILVNGTSQLAGPVGSVPGAGPATAGDFISIFMAGLGTVNNPPADGSPAVAGNPSTTPTMPKVTIGGVNAAVNFSGLAPGNVGLYQVNAQVPTGTGTGDAIPVIVTMGNGIANTVTIAVK